MCLYHYLLTPIFFLFFFFKQKTAYEIKECDWSSDVCSSDLASGSELRLFACERVRRSPLLGADDRPGPGAVAKARARSADIDEPRAQAAAQRGFVSAGAACRNSQSGMVFSTGGDTLRGVPAHRGGAERFSLLDHTAGRRGCPGGAVDCDDGIGGAFGRQTGWIAHGGMMPCL